MMGPPWVRFEQTFAGFQERRIEGNLHYLIRDFRRKVATRQVQNSNAKT